MINLGHGANTVDMASKYNKDPNVIIDFSANINPYKIKNLETYILEGLNKSSSYPDIEYTQLRQNIAAYLSCDKEHIIPGNGATEIMYLLMKCLKGPLAILNPTFSEYERSARLNHIEIVSFYLNKENEFVIDIEEIKSQLNTFEALFICNPNNPIGKVQNIKEILKLLQQHNKMLIVDETFIEFVDNEESFSLLKYIKTYSNLIIIKAATKFFGLPGIRLGYGITSNRPLLKEMAVYKEPWTVNTFADHLTNYIFKEKQYITETKAYFTQERKRMLKELDAIAHLKAYTTDTNFILIELRDLTANEMKHKLFEKYNLLVRDASNFKGLDEHFIRIAIKTQEENDLLISKLRDKSI